MYAELEISKWKEQLHEWLSAQEQSDDSHSMNHAERVWKTACQIIAQDKLECEINPLIILAACYFHDVVSLPKDHPDRASSSQLAAKKAEAVLVQLGFPEELIPAVMHAIEAHSFSGAIKPLTLEAKIVQDADRMEALGAIGLARVFYTAGLLQSLLFDANDPLAKSRELDDKKYALDHFKVKLLTLHQTMNTPSGKKLAKRNTQYLLHYLEKIDRELQGDYS